MGSRVYTWEQLQQLPYPETVQRMSDDKNRIGIARLTPAQNEWCQQLRQEIVQEMTHDTDGYMIGYGRNFHFPDALSIMVTPDFDVSDPDRFPDEYDGEPVIYIKMPAPEAY